MMFTNDDECYSSCCNGVEEDHNNTGPTTLDKEEPAPPSSTSSCPKHAGSCKWFLQALERRFDHSEPSLAPAFYQHMLTLMSSDNANQWNLQPQVNEPPPHSATTTPTTKTLVEVHVGIDEDCYCSSVHVLEMDTTHGWTIVCDQATKSVHCLSLACILAFSSSSTTASLGHTPSALPFVKP